MRILMLVAAVGLAASAQAVAQDRANTDAFARTPKASTSAFGGGKVTAFGDGGPTTNAAGDTHAATANARRMANSFGTGTDHNPSPIGPSKPGGGR